MKKIYITACLSNKIIKLSNLQKTTIKKITMSNNSVNKDLN